MARLSTKSSGKLSRVKRSDSGKIYNKVDPVLVAAVVGLMAFGVLMVYSAITVTSITICSSNS